MALSAPTGLTNTDDEIGSVTFTFTDQNAGAAWHMLERRLKSGGDWIEVASTDDQGDTTLVDQNADGLQSVGQVYEYRVRAFNGTPEFSGPSSTVEVSVSSSGPAVPALTSPTGSANGHNAADGSVDTDTGNGTLYWVLTQSSTKPSVAQIKAGQDHNGAAADDSGSQGVGTTGTQNVSANGLDPNTQYFFHFVHENSVGDPSSVVSSSGLTTGSIPDYAPLTDVTQVADLTSILG